MRLACIGALVLALLPILTTPAPAATASPDDWRDLVLYQIVTDRYANGSTANDQVEGNYNAADGYKIHGGDFNGIRQRLDYLQQLGVDGIWISPVVLNANAEYHGYAARDFFSIAPHFGTRAELQALVADAHARGMVVVIDVVVNHMGDLIDSGDGGYPNYRTPPASYTLRWRSSKHHVGFFDDLSRFHAQGQIGNFVDPEQILGELSGLDDLKTEDATVRDQLVAAGRWLIDSTDCDGFRVDTVKHVEMAFWDYWCPAVHAHADSVGKHHFFMFGEAFDGDDAKVGSYTGTMAGGSYEFDSQLYYPMYFTTVGVFGFNDPPAFISGRYGNLGFYDATSRERLVTFLDNHDNARFLSFGVANQDEGRLRAALGWLLTSRGVPCLYYGTEQEFDGGGDPYDREDMWDGQWDFGPSDGDNFDEAHPLFGFVRSLIDVRRRHAALRRGVTLERYAEGSGPGLYAYERRLSGDIVEVAVNTSNLPVTRTIATSFAAGTVVADALEPAILDTVGGGGSLALRVPARGVRIYEAAGAAVTGGLHVTACFPGHDLQVNDRFSPLTVTFDRDIDVAAVAGAFHVTPATAGSWTASGPRASFHPSAPWATGLTVAWSLDTTVAIGADGTRLRARFEANFRTAPMTLPIGVTAGYAVDRIARQGLTAPEGLMRSGWLAPDALLLSDPGRGRLFTLTPGGDLGHWLGDARWTKPVGLAYSATSGLVVGDASGGYAVDRERFTTVLPGSLPAGAAGALAFGGGAFGDTLYLADPGADRIDRLTGGVAGAFATGIKGANGVAFGPGGAWGSDLYVSDANLTTLSASLDGSGRIVRVDASGVATTIASDATLLKGVAALAFDDFGRFDHALYVADILNERLLRVDPSGAVSVFATGFANLCSSQCLAFGPDGALYVADAGSGDAYSNTHGSNAPAVYRIARTDATVAVPGAAAPATRLAPPEPNPARGEVRLRFALARESVVELAVFDVRGRRVRRIEAGTLEGGTHHARWDGRDESGRECPAGLYFVRLRGDGVDESRRIARVR